MIGIDANIISELMKPSPDIQVQNWLKATGDIPLVTTGVSIFEIEHGLQRLPTGRRRDDLHKRFTRFVGVLQVLPFDEPAALLAGQYRNP